MSNKFENFVDMVKKENDDLKKRVKKAKEEKKKIIKENKIVQK